jgi:vacuolar-type H+-ATPase subunit E/Vma4
MLIQLHVGQELRKMTQFIRQEATEKAREIELKADKEFAIEKSKLVYQEQGAIDLTYEKFKAAAIAACNSPEVSQYVPGPESSSERPS